MDQGFEGLPGRLHRALIRTADRIAGPTSAVRRALSPVYSWLLYAASGGRGLTGAINGEQYRLDPRYRWRLWPNYEEDLSRYLMAHVGPADCCVNVGANIGLHVLQFSRWVPHGRIIAFEPNPSSFRVLARHVRMNGIGDRVTLVQAAAGRAAGRARLFDTSAGSGLSRLGSANPAIEVPSRSVDVDVVSLDDWLASNGSVPQVVLIDVEGFEFEVLAGAARLLENRTARVIVEMHPQLWPGGENARREAEALLSRSRRRPVALDGREDPWSVGQTLLEPQMNEER